MENYNLSLVGVSFIMSVIGSFMALFITRAALLKPTKRNKLLIYAALCLGGVGIWSMHFIGMLSLNMSDIAMNFDWGLTAFSFVVGVIGVYLGLFVMCRGEMKISKLIFAGFLVGSAVVAMHYTGMVAMKMQADVSWNWGIISASVVIAIVAAIVALWLAVNVKQMWHIIVSAIVMGVAVCGMHYTGMAAAKFIHNPELPFVEPMTTTSFLFTATIVAIDVLIVLIAMAVAMAESNRRNFSAVRTL